MNTKAAIFNTVYHQSGKMKTEEVLADVQPRLSRAIRLVPAVKPMQLSRESRRDTDQEERSEQPQVPPRALRSWGEVFDIGQLQRDLGSEAALVWGAQPAGRWGLPETVVQTWTLRALQNGRLRPLVPAVRQGRHGSPWRVAPRWGTRPLGPWARLAAPPPRDRGLLRPMAGRSPFICTAAPFYGDSDSDTADSELLPDFSDAAPDAVARDGGRTVDVRPRGTR